VRTVALGIARDTNQNGSCLSTRIVAWTFQLAVDQRLQKTLHDAKGEQRFDGAGARPIALSVGTAS